MHLAKLLVAVFLLALVTGCPDADRNASIEASNKGVEAFKNESWETAIKNFSEAVKLWPGNHSAWYNLGQVYYQKKQLDKAAQAFEEAVRHHKTDPMYHLYLGIARYDDEIIKLQKEDRKPNYDGAEEALAKSLELNNDLYRGHWYLGRIYRDTGRPKLAAEAWTRGCMLNPSYGKPFVALGELYLNWDKVDEAIQVLSQGKQFVLENQDLSNVYYYLGMAYDVQARANPNDKSRWDASIEAYSQAIDHRADNGEARLQRGIAYINKGDVSRGQKDLDDFIKRGCVERETCAFEKQEAMKAMYGALAASGLPLTNP